MPHVKHDASVGVRLSYCLLRYINTPKDGLLSRNVAQSIADWVRMMEERSQ